jgi:hypothetical protein
MPTNLELHEPPPKRYLVIEGSDSCHCCFEYTIVDTHRPLKRFKNDTGFHTMCETFGKDEAHSICSALNQVHYGS